MRRSVDRAAHPRQRRSSRLRLLAEQVLESPDLPTLTQQLTRALPRVLGLPSATLLVWDRKLESFETHPIETLRRAPRTQATPPEARYLLSDDVLLESPGGGGSVLLVPLMARAGLVGMLSLELKPQHRVPPLGGRECRALSGLARRAALALENHLYQREIVLSERMAALGTMAGMLAHDFRGPMTVIRGYAETLLEPGLPAAELRGRAEIIMQNVDRLERMTAETLDFARGQERLVCRPVGLAAFLEETAARLAAEQPGLELVTCFTVPVAAQGSFDVDKVSRALGNMAANAREAMGGSGRLHLEARLEPDAAERRELEIVVRDEGPGIPAAIRERVFEPFVTQGKKQGTGLGLAVAKRFIEDHGGRLELLTDGPGAAFRISLPIDAGADRDAH
jgi:signal transduction histidine kinase